MLDIAIAQRDLRQVMPSDRDQRGIHPRGIRCGQLLEQGCRRRIVVEQEVQLAQGVQDRTLLRVLPEAFTHALCGMPKHFARGGIRTLHLAGVAEHQEQCLLHGLQSRLLAQGLVALALRFIGLQQCQPQANRECGEDRSDPGQLPAVRMQEAS